MVERAGSVGDMPSVVDNDTERRIELTIGDTTAFIDYVLSGQKIMMTHTEVPEEFRGKGVGSALVRGALDLARERELEVIPLCPFVVNYLRRHSEYLTLVSDKVRRQMQLG